MEEERLINSYDKHYLRCAKEVSNASDFPRVHIGCVIVQRHRLISSGYNSETKMSTLQSRVNSKHFKCHCSGKLHAETMAMLPFLKTHTSLKGATLYTYRETADGRLGKSRPCPRCMSLIKSLEIKKIVYTTEDGVAKEKLIY